MDYKKTNGFSVKIPPPPKGLTLAVLPRYLRYFRPFPLLFYSPGPLPAPIAAKTLSQHIRARAYRPRPHVRARRVAIPFSTKAEKREE